MRRGSCSRPQRPHSSLVMFILLSDYSLLRAVSLTCILLPNMGLDVNGVKFLLLALREGVSFASTATLGRQELLLDGVTLAELLTRFSQPTSRKEIEQLNTKW